MNTKKLRDRILKEVEQEKVVSTWHWNDFFDDCAEIMGWDVNDIIGNQRRLRYHLNKMAKEGILDKHKYCGTGFAGKYDFGYSHSNCYTLKK